MEIVSRNIEVDCNSMTDRSKGKVNLLREIVKSILFRSPSLEGVKNKQVLIELKRE